MTQVQLIYLVFCVAGLASFLRFKPRTAVLVCVLGAWAFLPNGTYPPAPIVTSSAVAGEVEGVNPYWILPVVLPADMLISKAWIGSLTAMLGVLIFDRCRLAQMRWRTLDVLPVIWCLSPFMTGLGAESSSPGPLVASVYLFASWGLLWVLGRLYFSKVEDQLALAKAMAWGAAAYLPISLLEGYMGPRVYEWIYGSHPFRAVGIERYIGYRPVGWLEDGNQLGMWLATGAVCAVGVAWLRGDRGSGKKYWILAGVIIVQLLAAQSVGAIALFFLAVLILVLSRWIPLREMLVALVVLLMLVGGVYVSGKIPASASKNSAVGQKIVSLFKGMGRGSFTWRIGQDQKIMKIATRHPVVGSGQWDWWRDQGLRPWGLELLILGQYGAVGLLFSYGVLMGPAIATGIRIGRRSNLAGDGQCGDQWVLKVLIVLLVMTLIDSLLNAFIILPVLMASAGLVGVDLARLKSPDNTAGGSAKMGDGLR